MSISMPVPAAVPGRDHDAHRRQGREWTSVFEVIVQFGLGEAWKTLTGLPFVFALWMTRLDACETMLGHVFESLRTIRANLDSWMISWRRRLGCDWPVELASRALNGLIRYELGPAELYDRKFRLAVEHGIVDTARRWRSTRVDVPRAPRFLDVIASLHHDLRFVPDNTKRRQMDDAGRLMPRHSAEQLYPLEYVIFRITRFRPEASDDDSAAAGGALFGILEPSSNRWLRHLHGSESVRRCRHRFG